MKLAIYGYDSITGRLVIEALERSSVNISEFYPLSPIANEYNAVPFNGKNHVISYIDDFDFSKVQVVLLLATKDETQRLSAKIQEAGCIIVDNSHLYSALKEVPIVLKDINPYDIEKVLVKKLASIPFASSSQLALSLNPLHDEYGIKNAVVSALLSVSEQGELGTQTLAKETIALLNGQSVDIIDFKAQLAFNLHHSIDNILANGISAYEQSVISEVNSIMDSFPLVLTCMQVPVFYGHTMNIHVELEEDASLDEIKKVYENIPYIVFEEEAIKEAQDEADEIARLEYASEKENKEPTAKVGDIVDSDDFADEIKDANEDESDLAPLDNQEEEDISKIKGQSSLHMITPVACADLESKLYICRLRKSARATFDFTVIMDNTRYGEAEVIVSLLDLLDKRLS